MEMTPFLITVIHVFIIITLLLNGSSRRVVSVVVCHRCLSVNNKCGCLQRESADLVAFEWTAAN